jgi:hypothetical protein
MGHACIVYEDAASYTPLFTSSVLYGLRLIKTTYNSRAQIKDLDDILNNGTIRAVEAFSCIVAAHINAQIISSMFRQSMNIALVAARNRVHAIAMFFSTAVRKNVPTGTGGTVSVIDFEPLPYPESMDPRTAMLDGLYMGLGMTR